VGSPKENSFTWSRRIACGSQCCDVGIQKSSSSNCRTGTPANFTRESALLLEKVFFLNNFRKEVFFSFYFYLLRLFFLKKNSRFWKIKKGFSFFLKKNVFFFLNKKKIKFYFLLNEINFQVLEA